MKKGLQALMPGKASEPAAFDSVDAVSMQAIAAGTATDGQQKRALNWILQAACGLPVWAYRESPRETDVALGRQFVGQQIMGILKVNVSRLRKREETNDG